MTAGSASLSAVAPRLTIMTADRSELHELIDALPDEQVPLAAEDLRRRTKARAERTTEPFAWIGAGVTKDGSTKVSANLDKHLSGFGRDSL